VKISDMSGWLSAKTYAEHLARAKVVIDVAPDYIVGPHLVGHAGEEIIQAHDFVQ
jgi:glutathione reductase (NADPH)